MELSPPVQSCNVAIEVELQPQPCFSDIDQSSLTRLVKEKNMEQLVQLGMVEGLAKTLKTGVENGIRGDSEDIQRRHEAFGTNTYHKPPTKGFFHFVWEAFKDLTVLILLVLAALSLAIGIKEHGLKEGWYDGGSIFVAVFLVITVSAATNFKLNRQLDTLSQVSNNIQVQVVRSGRRQQISIFEIVVGDIVFLKTGDQIPADGLFIDGHSLQVDESSMTGESEHVEVNHRQNPFLVSGTKVADGYVRMLVTSVGMNTIWGEMMSTISHDSDQQTPLQARLNKLTLSIAKVGLAVAFLSLVVWFVRYFMGNTKHENGKRESDGSKSIVIDKINAMVGIISAFLPREEGIIAAAVTIGVLAIPQIFPLAVTLTLAYGMRMMADQVMVRKLSACETMGSATTICVSKTGTLTLNDMKVTKFWPGKDSIEGANVLKLLHQGVGLNTTGSIYKPTSGTEFELSDSPTERAILSWAIPELNMVMEELMQSCTVLQVEPFNSEKKRSGVLISKKADNTINVHWKGAAEIILAMCSNFCDPLGNIKPLVDAERSKFDQIIHHMAASSLRCIAFAHKEISEEEHEERAAHQKLKDNDLTLLGFLGIQDLCRPGVKEVVEDCQSAQVKIKMITGDNIFTAKAIATECGILGPNQDMNGVVVEGVEFRNYTEEERMEKVDKICVMARSTPFDKHLMVQCLKQKGHVVAVVGNGTNDALALKEADIGLSMGIQGTEVSKQSSHVVILDDNFASISTVLRWGRCVLNNIQNFIQFQLMINIVALFINFVATVSAGEVPLTAFQLLWVNLIMDTLGALALATEQPTKELMEKPPVGRTEPLITNIMWRNLLPQALYQIVVLLILQFRGEAIFGVNKKVNVTLIFNTFVLCQVFNEFNARKLEKKNVFEGLHKNKLFLGIIGITILLQVVMVEVLKRFAGTESLDWGQWGACTGIAFISWPIGWLVKCIPVPEKPLYSYLKWQWQRQSLCSNALFSHFTETFAKDKRNVSPVQFSKVDIHTIQPRSCFFDIDQSSLTGLVNEKNMDNLEQFGMVEGLANTLKTEVKKGIDGDAQDIQNRHEAFGTNAYQKPPTKGFFHFVYEALKDITILILLVCAALSLAFGIKEHGLKEGWYDGGSIFVAVLLVITVSAVSDFRQNRQIDKLFQVSNNIQVEVVRTGRRQHISIFEIVVGDIVCLKTGDQIPADGLFIDGHSLHVDESSMTGESEHVEVNCSQNPFLFSGTKVADGYARMLVTAVGMNTMWGGMMSTISRDSDEQTPLQARLNQLLSLIGKIGFAVAFLILVVLLVRYFTGNTKDENGNTEFNSSKMKADDVINAVVKIIAAAVTIVVFAIPEGLVLAVTLSLAYSMKRMMADQAMVRKLSACETMGSATVICTDKTGTLTLNQMKVTKFWLGQESIEERSCTSIATNVLKLLQQAVGLNTTGSVYKPALGAEFEFSGSPTEKAILSWAVLELNMDMEELMQSCTILHVAPFNSEKKRSGVLMRNKADNTINVHWMGAAEMILAMCSDFYDCSGKIKALGDVERRKFDQIIEGMAASSLRCIVFGHKKVPEEEHKEGKAYRMLKENDLILLGLVGIKNPCRAGVKMAVKACQHAQVEIKMITGDNVFTATAIATECGILRPDQEIKGAVVKGVEFRNYTPDERMEKVDKIRVMARSTPSDKLLMVQCLKQKGHVVAVTGDRTNDAPALKEADIGLSMGIQGTDLAKQSSDIVILDDNFASISRVLRWGRCIYNNIQKFIQFLLTVNIVVLFINFVVAVSAGEVPLTAVQLLLVYLIMETLGALALVTERPTDELMEKPPVGRTEPLITNIMWRNLLAQALYQIAVLLILQFRGESIFGVNKKVNDTLIFNTFVLCQVFNEFNARKLEKQNVFKGIHKNKLFLGIIGITIVLQVIMVEALKKFAGTERLNWGQWGACTGIASISWPIGWLVKCIPVPEKPLFSYLKW